MNKAVIMAGGFGTRLRPLTMNLPKPMVPILNYPMMGHIINLLKEHGIKDILNVLYFQPEKITDYFQSGEDQGVSMEYVQAVADFGTAGAIRNAHEEIGLNERFIIISGDVLTDFDLTKAIEFHKEKGAMATLLLTRHDNPLQYGIVMASDDGKITRFLEKPSWGQVFSDTINTGIYIFEPEVLDLIPYKQEFDFSKDLFPLMLEKGLPLYGYIADGYWRDVGNLNEYQQGETDALTKKVKLDSSLYENDKKFPDSVKVEGTVKLGKNVEIGENCFLKDSSIGDNVKIGSNSRIIGSTVWEDVTVGNFVEITDDVICNNVEIGNYATIQENVFIANNCRIGESSTLLSNIKLWPNKDIQAASVVTRSLVQEEKWQRELFNEARITGLSNIDIHPEFGAKLGACLGMVLGPKTKILASRDPNQVSRVMKRSITSGLMSVGVSTNDLQVHSIPQTRQELRSGKYDAGLHVRRSPRNPDNTDIVIFSKEGRDISLNVSKKIERFFYGEEIHRVHRDEVGGLSFPERTNEIYINRYVRSLDKDLIASKNFKILVDYSYGFASTILPGILGKLNVTALSLNDYVDATKFHPDPTINDHALSESGSIMQSLGYNLGFTMESGSEKIALIDQRGKWLKPQRLLSIVTKLVLETNKEKEPYKIAVSVVASEEIDKIAFDYDVDIVRIKNNHSAMMEATKDEKVKFVGGVYGGFIFPEFLFASDGMYSVGKIIEMLAKTNMSPNQLDDELPQRYQVEMKVECSWNKKGTIMRNLMDYSNDKQRQLVEGVKIFENNTSALMIPSKETGEFSIYGEADTFEEAEKVANKYKDLINDWLTK